MAGMQTVPAFFQLRASRLLALKPTGGGDTGEKEEGGFRRPPHPDRGESWRGPPRTGRALGPRGPRRLARSPQPRPATICSGFTSAAPGARAPAPVRAPRPPPPAYLLRWSRVLVSPKPPPPAKFPLSERPLDADGTAAMFAPRLLDFQKTKYAR